MAVKKWGFLVDAKEQKSIAGGVDIKIFDENGKMNILPAHTNVMCDGEKLSGTDLVSKLNSLKSTLVMFSETDDEIYEIDSDFKGENEEDFSVCKILEGTASMRWNRYQNVLGLKYPISDSAKIFSVPQTASDDNNDYSVKSVSSLLQDKFYTLTLYTLRGQGGQAKAAVMFNELKPSAISNGNMKAAVIDYVSKAFGVTAADINSDKRQSKINTARQVAMYVLKEVTDLTLQEIGEYFKKTHATVIHALTTVAQKMQDTPNVRTIATGAIQEFQEKQ